MTIGHYIDQWSLSGSKLISQWSILITGCPFRSIKAERRTSGSAGEQRANLLSKSARRETTAPRALNAHSQNLLQFGELQKRPICPPLRRHVVDRLRTRSEWIPTCDAFPRFHF